MTEFMNSGTQENTLVFAGSKMKFSQTETQVIQ